MTLDFYKTAVMKRFPTANALSFSTLTNKVFMITTMTGSFVKPLSCEATEFEAWKKAHEEHVESVKHGENSIDDFKNAVQQLRRDADTLKIIVDKLPICFKHHDRDFLNDLINKYKNTNTFDRVKFKNIPISEMEKEELMAVICYFTRR